jgi:hypothetical protein
MAERILIIDLIQDGLIQLNKFRDIYPDLFGYLGTSYNEYYNVSWIADYFFEYKLSKLMNKPTEKYINIISQQDEQYFYSWYSNSHKSLDKLSQHNYDILVILDGVGVEYFDYIIYCIQHMKKFVLYADISSSYLPSITTINKKYLEGKYNKWISDFDDKVVHRLFYNSSIIPESLSILQNILYKLFLEYPNKRIAITSDHGVTCRGKFMQSKKKYSLNSEHEGRCMKVQTFDKINKTADYTFYNDTSSDERWVLSINDISLNDNPKRESHGGATLEETLIPCIIISDMNNPIKFSFNPIKTIVNGLDKIIKIEITPHIDIHPLLIEEDDTVHEMYQEGNNIWCCNINLIKSQTVQVKIPNYNINIEVTSSSGINKKGADGFDD